MNVHTVTSKALPTGWLCAELGAGREGPQGIRSRGWRSFAKPYGSRPRHPLLDHKTLCTSSMLEGPCCRPQGAGDARGVGGGGARKAHFPSLRPLRPGSPPAGLLAATELNEEVPTTGSGEGCGRRAGGQENPGERPGHSCQARSRDGRRLRVQGKQAVVAALPAPPPSPSSEGANVQTRPCHIKANLRHEKRLLKRVLPKRGLHGNPGACVHDEQGSGPTTAPGCGACPGHRHMRGSLGPPRCSVTSGKPCDPCCPRGQRRPRVSWARWRSPAGGPKPQPPGQPSFGPGSDWLLPLIYDPTPGRAMVT